MTDSELLELFAEGLEVDASTLTPETRIEDVEEWNSLGWLTIMSLLDERYGLQLDAAAIRSFRTAGETMQAIRAKASA